MLRGINKQDIFFNEDDFLKMMTILHDIPFIQDEETGISCPKRCSIYAYCILHNHLHLLIREGCQSLAEIMKVIEVSYVGYYNKKYQRVGHLFQGRFASEPINDDKYFFTVLRYIALNPVKAMEASLPEDYPYSSWNEYVCHPSNIMKVLKPSCINAVLTKYSLQNLKEWIAQYNEDHCLDMNDFNSVKSDDEAWEILSEISNLTNPEDFRMLDPQTQVLYLLESIDHGVNLSQASRLGTITRYQLTKIYEKRCGTNPALGSDPVAEENVEQIPENEISLDNIQNEVRHIEGLGKKTYHQLHLIVEYMYSHPQTRCNDLSEHLGISNESSRRLLVLLINENIIQMIGSKKNRIYMLKMWNKPASGSDPNAEKMWNKR